MPATLTALIALAILVFLWLDALWRPRPLPGVKRSRPLAIGHRGVRGPLPENTLEAFRMAFDAGLDGIETDVQRTRDGQLVLFHDFSMGGTPITALLASELRAMTRNLCTLDELLELARSYPGTLLNLELKSLGWRDGGLAEAVAARVRETQLEERVIVSSFNPIALARTRLAAPELRTAFLFTPDASAPALLRSAWPAAWLHADAVHPHKSAITPESVRQWRQRGLMVNVWTVNDSDEVARVVAAGVDAVIADDPPALLAAMGRPG